MVASSITISNATNRFTAVNSQTFLNILNIRKALLTKAIVSKRVMRTYLKSTLIFRFIEF